MPRVRDEETRRRTSRGLLLMRKWEKKRKKNYSMIH
jgi:hypothetical protein